jgi:hypothetical protein
LEILEVERDELEAPERAGEPEQQHRPIPKAGERSDVDRLEQACEQLELERLGFAQRPHAVLAVDAREDQRPRPSRTGLGSSCARGVSARQWPFSELACTMISLGAFVWRTDPVEITAARPASFTRPTRVLLSAGERSVGG